jgi:hypothetical protein
LREPYPKKKKKKEKRRRLEKKKEIQEIFELKISFFKSKNKS